MSDEDEHVEQVQMGPSVFRTELERAVFSEVTESLYTTEARKKINKKHPAASNDEIDAVLISPGMKRQISQSVEAFLQQQLPALLEKIFKQADDGQNWACKLVLELTGIAELLRVAVSQAEGELEETQVISELERGLVESFRQLVAGEGKEEVQPDGGSK
mgnify:CR=1 FL=1